MPQDIYTADRILKQRTRGGKAEYFVKWKGWSEKYNTWEPACNILDKRLIQLFRQKKSTNDRHTASVAPATSPSTRASAIKISYVASATPRCTRNSSNHDVALLSSTATDMELTIGTPLVPALCSFSSVSSASTCSPPLASPIVAPERERLLLRVPRSCLEQFPQHKCYNSTPLRVVDRLVCNDEADDEANETSDSHSNASSDSAILCAEPEICREAACQTAIDIPPSPKKIVILEESNKIDNIQHSPYVKKSFEKASEERDTTVSCLVDKNNFSKQPIAAQTCSNSNTLKMKESFPIIFPSAILETINLSCATPNSIVQTCGNCNDETQVIDRTENRTENRTALSSLSSPVCVQPKNADDATNQLLSMAYLPIQGLMDGITGKKKRGRPKGSKNKKKCDQSVERVPLNVNVPSSLVGVPGVVRITNQRAYLLNSIVLTNVMVNGIDVMFRECLDGDIGFFGQSGVESSSEYLSEKKENFHVELKITDEEDSAEEDDALDQQLEDEDDPDSPKPLEIAFEAPVASSTLVSSPSPQAALNPLHCSTQNSILQDAVRPRVAQVLADVRPQALQTTITYKRSGAGNSPLRLIAPAKISRISPNKLVNPTLQGSFRHQQQAQVSPKQQHIICGGVARPRIMLAEGVEELPMDLTVKKT